MPQTFVHVILFNRRQLLEFNKSSLSTPPNFNILHKAHIDSEGSFQHFCFKSTSKECAFVDHVKSSQKSFSRVQEFPILFCSVIVSTNSTGSNYGE